MVDAGCDSPRELRLEQRVREDLVVEDLLGAMKCRIASGMLIQRLHARHESKPKHHWHPSEAAFAGGETRINTETG